MTDGSDRIEITADADADLEELVGYIADRNRDAGDRVSSRFCREPS